MTSTGKTAKKKRTLDAQNKPGWQPPKWLAGNVPAVAKGSSWVAIALIALSKVDAGRWDELVRKAFQELMKNNGPGPVLLGIFIVGMFILMAVGAGAVFRHMQAEIHRQVDEKKWMQEQLVGRAPSSSEETGGNT